MSVTLLAQWVSASCAPPLLAAVQWSVATEPQVHGDHLAVVWHLVDTGEALAAWHRSALPDWDDLVQTRAVILVAPSLPLDQRFAWLLRGVQDILESAADLERALHHAAARQQREISNRLAYATDVATGLPHQAQLVEHMNHLLALREREPAPMVLIALRVLGLERAAERLGEESAAVLRRKVGVRLRNCLRAGDVLASTTRDGFAVMLGHIEAAADGERVLAKLVRAVEAPIQVSGQPFELSVSAGLACYPQDGKQAAELLQRATSQASSWLSMGQEGLGQVASRAAQASANDEGTALN